MHHEMLMLSRQQGEREEDQVTQLSQAHVHAHTPFWLSSVRLQWSEETRSGARRRQGRRAAVEGRGL